MPSSAKDKKDLIISETLRPNKGYLPLSRLRLLKHQTQWPATCLVATQQDHKLIFKKKLHLNSGVILKFLAWLLNQRCISKGSKTNGLGRASKMSAEVPASPNRTRIGNLVSTPRHRHPHKILLQPQDWPWTADCGLFQECTKAPAWRRWHEWAQLKLANKQTIIRNYAISGISAYL